MKKILISLFAFTIALGASGQKKDMNAFIDNLMSKMTLQEKIGQLNLMVAGDITTGGAMNNQVCDDIIKGNMGGVFNIKGVEKIKALQDVAVKKSRLGIPLIIGMDVIHGYETIFPIPLAQSCSWDVNAVEKAASIAAKEATADGINWFYSPMVDICIDPRWGRMAEGNGEDPFLSGIMAQAYIRGYQGNYGTENGMACVKHYALYGAVEAGRDYNTVDMSRMRMFNQYLPPYKAAVDAGAGSVMTSFNIVDGIPATANKWLVNDVLRNKWKFNGFVVTDYNSIKEMTVHGVGDLQSSSARALKAGTDMDMCAQGFLSTLQKSVNEGKVSVSDIDIACRRILEAKYKLGLFENPYRYCDKNRRARDIYTDENRAAARDFAPETFVLLKNDNDILPLKKTGKIALVGPLANNKANMAGTWCVAYTPERYSTLKESMEHALQGKAQLLYAQGSNIVADDEEQVAAEFGKTIPRGDDAVMLKEALRIAKESDVIVCAVGECADMSGESSSRADLHTPDAQLRLLKELKKTGKPIVMLNFSGRPTILDWEQQNLNAIMNVWFAGSEAADAICDVLFGDKAPSGKLTATFPKSMGQIPLYYNHFNTGRPVAEGTDSYRKYCSNYLDVRNDALYPFGYGLTYTSFEYGDIVLDKDNISAEDSISASIIVTNTGLRDADEIIQLYIRDIEGSVVRPVKELKAFRRVSIKHGESKRISFSITPNMLKFYNYDLNEVVEPGEFDVMIGPNSRDLKRKTFIVR